MLKLKKLPVRNLTKFESITSRRLIFPKQQVRNIFLKNNKNNNLIKKIIRQKSDKSGGNGGQNPNKNTSLIYIIVGIGAAIFFYAEYNMISNSQAQSVREITMEQFFHLVESQSLESVTYNPNNNHIEVKATSAHVLEQNGSYQSTSNQLFYFEVLNFDQFEKRLQQVERELGILPSESTSIKFLKDATKGPSLLTNPFVVISALLLGIYLARKTVPSNIGGGPGGPGGMFSMTKMDKLSKVKPDVTFKDVAGMTEAKAEIQEFVSYLKNPEKFQKLGAKIPRGALLTGPPGTGKTLLAKAVAGETDVDFYSMSGSDFVEVYVGVGAARVRDLFKQARKSKNAIIFIDEIDAIGKPRDSGPSRGGNDERESTLNQLLVELDGFTENENIIIFASTNVSPEDLDSALLRPGRFDRQISIDKPDQAGRVEIYNIHIKPIKIGEEISAERLAELTPGFVGADIANVCNEAAIIAARREAEFVTMKDFENAIERVIAGIERKNKPITLDEKKRIAYHESGHALVAWYSKYCDPLLKISVIPRGKALGYAQYVPIERHIHTKDHMMDVMAQALGGRAAEKVVFDQISTGAQDDLRKVTRMAYGAVSVYGMASSVGALGFPMPNDPSASYQKPYGEKVALNIDIEARKLVTVAYENAEKILRQKREMLDNVANYLIEHEVMSVEQFKEVVGPREIE
eukprot:gene5033-8630_t